MRLAYLVVSMLPFAACSLQRTPIMDRDAPALDAGRPPDGSICDPTACNDGNPCTDDRCGSAGCDHIPNVVACDDGLFCTSGEVCGGGTCGAGRETCPSCDEAANACGACETDEECPEPTVGTCTFADVCATMGSMASTSFRCETGRCVAVTMNSPCPRTTDGTSCGANMVTRGECMRTGMSCSRGGAVAVSTTSFVCGAGTCASRTMVASEACDHEPTGDPCRVCTEGECVVPLGMCGGSITRSCGEGTCASTGACTSGSTDTIETVMCTAAAGATCGTNVMCGPCSRDLIGSGCGTNCSYVIGSCAGATCNSGGGLTMYGRFDCPCM